MISVTRASLAMIATLGIGTLVAVPAAHAAKAKAAEAPKGAAPQLSPPFRKAFVDLQGAVKSGNVADIQAKMAVAEPLATMPDEKFYMGVMRFELAKLTKDRSQTRKAVNEMVASGSKQIQNLPELYYNAGALAYEAGDYADATAKLAEADRLGSKDVNRLLLGAESGFKQNQTAAGLALLSRAVAEYRASGQQPPQDWFRRALSVALKAKMSSDILTWSRDLVRTYPTATNWRDALVLYRDSGKLEPLAQLDIFRLMRETKSLAGERDFYDYAEVANNRALPGEAKVVIEEGFASNAVPRTSKAVNEMLVLANSKITADRASVANDDRASRAAKLGTLAANTGNAYLAYGDYAKAVELLQLALSKGGADNDAINTRLGIALTKLGQKDAAKKAFSSVGGARTEIAKYWMLYLELNP